MCKLENKSGINQSAAELLSDKGFYAPSVHCSYYSCIQLMKHLLLCCYKKSEQTIFQEVKDGTDHNFHNYIINFFVREISHKSRNKNDSSTFRNKINSLKALRNKADYEAKDVDSPSCRAAITTSVEIIDMLRKTKF